MVLRTARVGRTLRVGDTLRASKSGRIRETVKATKTLRDGRSVWITGVVGVRQIVRVGEDTEDRGSRRRPWSTPRSVVLS